MLKCQHITELASKQFEKNLSIWQRMEMKMHLWMCKHCYLYVKHLKFIQKVAEKINQNKKNTGLSDEARERIQQRLNQTL